jgi:hypothetical protein
MTQEQKFHLLQIAPTSPKTDDEAILGATAAALVLFPGCETWQREGNFVYDPVTDEAIYLPLEDLNAAERFITKGPES